MRYILYVNCVCGGLPYLKVGALFDHQAWKNIVIGSGCGIAEGKVRLTNAGILQGQEKGRVDLERKVIWLIKNASRLGIETLE